MSMDTIHNNQNDNNRKSLNGPKQLLVALGIVWALLWYNRSSIGNNLESNYHKEIVETIEPKEPLEEWVYYSDAEDLGSNSMWHIYQEKYRHNIPTLKLSSSDIYKKPLDLNYKNIIKDKKISIDRSSSDVTNRVVRVLRFADISDKIESLYGIPNGLLLALAAHESTWNPLLPNLWWDGWAWLSHIQWINAKRFWLSTLPLYNNKMVDREHGKKIKQALEKSSMHMEYMIDKDDRFHPVLGLDVVWRFILDLKRWKSRNHSWQDLWLHILKWYSGRWDSYIYEILDYWYTIQSYRWKKLPRFSEWYENYIKWLENNVDIRKKLIDGEDVVEWTRTHTWFRSQIDGQSVSTEEYFQYFKDRLVNYEFDKYSAFMDRKAIVTSYNIIDQNVINSQWFRIYKKTNTSNISDLIDLLNDLNNWSYKRVGADNIVDRNGNPLDILSKNKIVYIKIRFIPQDITR